MAVQAFAPGASADFFFVEKNEPADMLETLKLLVKDRIPEKFGFDPVNDVQVLTPMHRGLLGVQLERRASGLLNPQGASVVHGSWQSSRRTALASGLRGVHPRTQNGKGALVAAAWQNS